MSDINNVYKTPNANLEKPNNGEAELANRGTRFIAALIDGIIGLFVGILIMSFLGVWQDIQRGIQPGLDVMFTLSALGFVAFVILHGNFLMKYGQTIGKRLMKIQIVDMNSNIAPFGRILGLRYLPISVVSALPVVNLLPIVDILFIFRNDRRCVHDLIAGTQVINFR